jgi:inner membrane protein
MDEDFISLQSISISKESPRKAQSVLWKVLMIIGLILGLLIPLNRIGATIAERQIAKSRVQAEIAQTWATEQTILGPVLVVPYKGRIDEYLNDQGQKQLRSNKEFAYIFPQQFQADIDIKPETRSRGIYQSVIYTSDLKAKGAFNLKTIEELGIPKGSILWKEAFIAFGIPSMKGINKRPEFSVQGKQLELLPGVNGVSFINSGLYTPVALSADQSNVPFNLMLSLKGSQSFSIIPVGKQNTITLSSAWASPSFIGGTLPSSRQLNNKGFRATWEIPYFARGYGQSFTDVSTIQTRIVESSVGVQLLNPVDSYRQSDRAIKYSVLFLVLTFSTFFLFEIISKYRLHPFQYLLVGCALSLFYLLLIAISEVSYFETAYGIASLAIISVTTLYCKAILGKIRAHAQWIIGGLLTILYAYLYVLLQLEDLSLLFGSIGLFVVLMVMMYVTRNIDWYNEQISA